MIRQAGKRGSVALLTAIMAPVMLMLLAMAIEVTFWSVNKLELQRIADASAFAGALNYLANSNAQTATQSAADVAEINGIAGAATRTWTATTSTLTDNLVTAQMVGGVKVSSDAAFKVIVKRSIATTFSGIFPGSKPAITLSATAVAEIGGLGPQPCIVALGGGVDGTTTGSDITFSGSPTLVTTGCSVRSNDGILMSGFGTYNASSVYAGGSISASMCCNLHPNSGQIPDPYLSYAPLQTALNAMTPGTGTAVVVSSKIQSLSPGTYSGWTLSGGATLNLNPGLYTVNGNISASGASTVTGTGVTIVMSGSLSTSGNSTLTLTAPGLHPTGGAISGVVIAGRGTGGMSFSGSSTGPVIGLIYFPNGSLTFSGSSAAGGAGCTQIIAATFAISGTTSLAANCTQFGLRSFSSLPATITLVQ